MKMIKTNILFPFLMALSLLTRLPIARFLPEQWEVEQQGLSSLFYPLVGFVLTVILFSLSILLPENSNVFIGALLIVFTWVVLTGALHLDGLADSVDAAFFSHHLIINKSTKKNEADIDSILAVFKDPTAGVMAVVAITFTLLFKVLLLSQLMGHLWLVLLVTLVVSRTLALLLLISTPYVSPKGLGLSLVSHARKELAVVVIVVVVLMVFYFLPLLTAFLLVFLLGASCGENFGCPG
jgi:adenosylcobinamide-GDP ribazoletransferase